MALQSRPKFSWMIYKKTSFCDLIANLFDHCSIYHSPTMSKDKGLWVCVPTKPSCWVCPWCIISEHQDTMSMVSSSAREWPNSKCPTCRLPHLKVHPSHNETDAISVCVLFDVNLVKIFLRQLKVETNWLAKNLNRDVFHSLHCCTAQNLHWYETLIS